MSSQSTSPARRLSGRNARMLFYLLVLAVAAAWRFMPRPWDPTTTLTTAHYQISSSATREQTDGMGRAAESLYRCYARLFGNLPTYQADHPKLQMILYKDRDEMRRINPGMGWEEAFYRKPVCRAYFSADEDNPYHWMIHEAVHQLNEEVANLDLAKWLDEGLAEYLSISRIHDGELQPGTIDPFVYPVWWIAKIATEGDLQKDIANGSIIPLRDIIDDSGPSMSKNVNLYYLHWWTLAHFVFEKHPAKAKELLTAGGTLEAFERLIGPVEQVQPQWHAHVLRIKSMVERPTRHFETTGELTAK